MSATYSIGEVASRVGLSTSALRYYETLGLLSEPERVSGRRRYDQATLDRLAMIDVAQRAGFTLREVGELLSGLQNDTAPTEQWRALATDKLAEIEQLIARADAMRTLLRTWLDCECLTLEDIDAFRRANEQWAHANQNSRALVRRNPGETTMTNDQPVACSLGADDLRRRLAAIAGIGVDSLLDRRLEDGQHVLRFRADATTRSRLDEIVAAEADCCPFLDLALVEDGGELVLTITAPDDAQPVADDLALAFAGGRS